MLYCFFGAPLFSDKNERNYRADYSHWRMAATVLGQTSLLGWRGIIFLWYMQKMLDLSLKLKCIGIGTEDDLSQRWCNYLWKQWPVLPAVEKINLLRERALVGQMQSVLLYSPFKGGLRNLWIKISGLGFNRWNAIVGYCAFWQIAGPANVVYLKLSRNQFLFLLYVAAEIRKSAWGEELKTSKAWTFGEGSVP